MSDKGDISARIIRDAAQVGDLDDWGPCPEATGAPMATRGKYLWKEDDTDTDSGIWECEAGPSRWVLETHEFMHVLSGSMTITPDGGEPEKIGPGDSIFIPRGWSGNWELHSTLRKVYVIF